jgi:hypothetical protein
MSALNMPGFTAEHSLYRTEGHYRLATGRAGRIVAPVGNFIVPQLRKIDWECARDCLDAGGDMGICGFFCEEQGEDGGGIPEPVCRPGCSRCSRVPGKPGLWKTCITRDCDDREVRCR